VSSARNASVSAGVGGRPVRSKVTRRRSVRRSAGGAGSIPAFSSAASTNASIGVRTQSPRETAGGSGRAIGRSDQNFRPSSRLMPTGPPPPAAAGGSLGSAAPAATQRSITATSAAESRVWGGIWRSGLV